MWKQKCIFKIFKYLLFGAGMEDFIPKKERETLHLLVCGSFRNALIIQDVVCDDNNFNKLFNSKSDNFRHKSGQLLKCIICIL